MKSASVTVSATGQASVHTGVRGSDSLAHKRELIESSLDHYTRFSPGCPQSLREAIRHSLLPPGKRLRPMLVMLAAEACGATADAALPAACAVEMIHTYSLIHDDLPAMDNDDMRRGKPACHKKFGEATAILAGDALLALAFEILAREITPADVAMQCVLTLSQAAGPTQLVGGQCDDLCQHVGSGSRELLESIHNRKTGALFLACLRLGGLIGNATAEQHEALRTYGENLGLAFQITDDLLDFHGDRRGNGHSASGSDAGKLTFPNLIGVEKSRTAVVSLVNAACAALAPLGTSARSLSALASFVSDRI
jgi:geranylgeranyl diphosphate synthase, type II